MQLPLDPLPVVVLNVILDGAYEPVERLKRGEKERILEGISARSYEIPFSITHRNSTENGIGMAEAVQEREKRGCAAAEDQEEEILFFLPIRKLPFKY